MSREKEFNQVDECTEEKPSNSNSCTCSNKECNCQKYKEEYRLKYYILMGEEKDLSHYIKDVYLLPVDDKNKKNIDEINNRLKLQKELLDLDQGVRNIGIARCNQIIGVYENQHQLALWAVVFTVFGFLIEATDTPATILVPYLTLVLFILIIMIITLYIWNRRIKSIYYLKALLEQTSREC